MPLRRTLLKNVRGTRRRCVAAEKGDCPNSVRPKVALFSSEVFREFPSALARILLAFFVHRHNSVKMTGASHGGRERTAHEGRAATTEETTETSAAAPAEPEEVARPERSRAAGVLSDQLVDIGLSSKKESQPDHQIRLVCVKCSPHTSRGKYRGGTTGVDSDGILRIATNLLDVPAEIIGLLYSWRWTIEIFFAS
jgi:hypothetical protein